MDGEGEAFDDGGLAHTGVAKQDGVVFAAPGEGLDQEPHFLLAADEGVDQAKGGTRHQIGSKGLERTLETVAFALRFGVLVLLQTVSPDRLLFRDAVREEARHREPGHTLALEQIGGLRLLLPHH